MLKEFKEFALKGNVLDMAIGVIIGGAFGKIVSSLVGDIIMPVFGFLTAGMDFEKMGYTLSEATVVDGVEVAPAAIIKYGAFIQNIVDFLIIAVCIFAFIKLINRLTEKAKQLNGKKEPEAAPAEPEAPPAPTQEELLTEIRDLLRTK